MLDDCYGYLCEIDSDDGNIFRFKEFHAADERLECVFETVGELVAEHDNHYDLVLRFGEQYVIFDMVILRSTSKSWQSDGQDTDGSVSVVFEYKYCAYYMGITKYNVYSDLPSKVKIDLERIKLLES